MNRKQLILLLAVLLVIGGAGLILINRSKEMWAVPETKMGDKVMPKFQPNDVASIHIKGVYDLNLVHKDDVWRVQERFNYPANFHQISDLLIKLKELKVVESDTVDPSELGRVNLDPPGDGQGSGTLVEFKNADGKVIDSLLVGKKHMRDAVDPHSPLGGNADGCYILLPSDPKEVLLISDPLGNVQANPSAWLSEDFLKVQKMKSCSLASANPAGSWKLSRESESSAWVLADAKPDEALDMGKASQIASTLSAPRFVDVLPANAAGRSGLDKPMVVTIETFDNINYTLKIGEKSQKGNYYVTVAETAQTPAEKAKAEKLAGWVYLVGSWIMDPLLRERAQILQGAPAENPAATTTPATPPVKKESSWSPAVVQ